MRVDTLINSYLDVITKTYQITDEEVGIIKSAQAGNILAFNKLFYRYKPFVDGILYHYIKDLDEAKDITNIVFLKVYEKLSQFTDYNSFGGWLRILTNRTAIDYLRSIKNKAKPIGEKSERLSQAASISSDENDLVNRISYERILEEFDKFPTHMKQILELYYVENMTVAQISDVLSIPTGTIKSILSRTRNKMKSKFKKL